MYEALEFALQGGWCIPARQLRLVGGASLENIEILGTAVFGLANKIVA